MRAKKSKPYMTAEQRKRLAYIARVWKRTGFPPGYNCGGYVQPWRMKE